MDEATEPFLDCGTVGLSTTTIKAQLSDVDNRSSKLHAGAPSPSNGFYILPHVPQGV